MALLRLLICVLLLVAAYVILKRVLGLLLSKFAKNKYVRVDVKAVGLGIAQGIHIQLQQGPVANIWVQEISLGRTRGARKLYDGLARAAATSQWRLPLTVRGVRLELRSRSPSDPSSGHTRKRKGAVNVSGLAKSFAARAVLGLLPFVPVRVKEVQVVHKDTGLRLDIGRLELFLKSPQLFSKLEADLRVLPILLSLETGPGSMQEQRDNSPSTSSNRIHVLSIKETKAGVSLLWAREGLGLRCKAMSCEVGDVLATVSLPLLLALASLPVQPKRARTRRKPGKGIDVRSLVSHMPDKVDVKVPLVRLDADGSGSEGRKLELGLESHSLTLASCKPDAGTHQELYSVAFTSGPLQCRGGLAGQLAAASVSCAGVGVEGHLLQRDSQKRQAFDAQPSSGVPEEAELRHTLSLSSSVKELVTEGCPEAGWAAVAEAQAILQLLHERRQSSARSVLLPESSADKGSLGGVLAATAIAAGDAAGADVGLRHRLTNGAAANGTALSVGEDLSGTSRGRALPGESSSLAEEAERRTLEAAVAAERPGGLPLEAAAEEVVSTSGRGSESSGALDWEWRLELGQDSRLDLLDCSGDVMLRCSFDEAGMRAGTTPPSNGPEARIPSTTRRDLGKLRAMFQVEGGKVLVRCQAAGAEPLSAGKQLRVLCSAKELALGAHSAPRKAVTTPTAELHLIGVLDLQGVLLMTDTALLSGLVSLMPAMHPPRGLLRRSAKLPSSSRGAKKPQKVRFVGASVRLVEILAGFSTEVEVAERFRPAGSGSEKRSCSQQLALGEVIADAGFLASTATLTVRDIKVAALEQPVSSGSSLPTLRVELLKVTGQHSGSPVGEGIQTPSLSVELTGVRAFFEADAVFLACKVAAELKALQAMLQAAMLAAQPAADPLVKSVNAADASFPADIGTSPDGSAPRSEKPRRSSLLARLNMDLEVRSLALEARLSETVLWGASLQQAQVALQPRNATLQGLAFLLNNAELARVAGAAISLQLPGQDSRWPAGGPSGSGFVTPRRGHAHRNSFGASVDEDSDETVIISPRSHAHSAGRRSAALSQESLPSVTEDMELDLGSPEVTGKSLAQPYAGSESQRDAAYHRAGLSSWASEPSASAPAPAPSGKAQKAGREPPTAAAIVECCLYDILVTLPYGQEPGTAQRFTELWMKAFEEALKKHLQPLKRQKAAKGGKPASERPVELRLALRGVLFKMDHHPLEAWLAVKGPLLRAAVTQDSLWARALASLDSRYPASPGTNLDADALSPRKQQERCAAMSAEIARSYRARSEQASTDQSLGTRQGALMHGSAESVDAILVIGGTGPQALASATETIEAVDSASKGVPMRQVRKLYLDVTIDNTAVYFSGSSKPLAALSGLVVSGPLVVARQVTAPPQQYQRGIRVGRQREVEIPVTVKGSRALIKVYTDLTATAEEPRIWFGIGLEPTIALVAQAGKRLNPSDPDKSRPRPPTLPWFDMLRFVWRGNLDIHARNLEFVLGATADPNLNSASERLQVAAETVRLQMLPGRIVFAFTALSAHGYLSAGLDQPAGMLHMLPLIDFPACGITLDVDWLLPGGRNPTDHHLFPVPVPAGQQAPVDVVGSYQCTGINLRLSAQCGNTATVSADPDDVSGLGDPWSTAEARGLGGGDPSSAAIVYLGGHQIAFLRALVERLQCPPLWNKLVNRRGTYFQRLDPKRAPILPMPKLLRRLDLRVAAKPFDLVNYTVDLDEASCGIMVSAAEVAFASDILLNLPEPRPILQGYSQMSVKREKMRTASAILEMDMHASTVRLHWRDASDWDKQRYRQSQDTLMKTLDRGMHNSTRMSTASTEALRLLMRGNSNSDVFIAAVSHLRLHETRPDPRAKAPKGSSAQQRRPLRIAIKDCRFLVDREARNTVIGAVMHLVGAFRLPRRHQVFQPHMVWGSEDISVPTTPGSARGRRHCSRDVLGTSFDSESGTKVPELLSLLLQQRDERGSDDEEAPPAELSLPDRDGVESDDEVRELDAEGRAKGEQEDSAVRAQLRDANQGAKDRAWQEEEAEWQQGVEKWEVEIEALQICLQAEVAGGRFLLAAQRAGLAGRHLEASCLDAIHLDVDQVQAFVEQTIVNPGSVATWLGYQNCRLQQERLGAADPLRSVFSPFSLKLRNTKVVLSGDESPARGRRGAGEETRLLVPAIGVNMNSREFHVMQDVINNVGLAQAPEVKSVFHDIQLLQEPESYEVANMRDTYASLRNYLATLMAETFALRAALGMRMLKAGSGSRNHYQPLSRSSFSMSRLSQTEMLQAVNLADALEDVTSITDALADYLSRLSRPDIPQDGLALGLAVGQQLVLKWGQEQVDGARQALQATADSLRDLKQAAQRRRQARHATRFVLEVDGVSWALCHEGMAFLEVSLVAIVLDSIRHRDQSGSSKLVIQRAEVRDATGQLGATPGTPAGAVVVPWNPDPSWERDALLRVNAVLGPPTRTHTVYEHLDVMMHPLGVHLNEAVATTFWEYFFPKEDNVASKRQERWVDSVKPKARHSRRGSAASIPGVSSDSEGPPPPPASVFASGPGPLEAAVGGTASASTSPGATTTLSAPATTERGHRRGQSWDSGSGAEEMARVVQSQPVAPLDPAILQSAWLENLIKQGSSNMSSTGGSSTGPPKGAGHRKSASVDESSAAHAAASAAGVTLQVADSPRQEKRFMRKKKAQEQPAVRKVMFKHVRINRFHCRATYQGYPISFSDFKMVLDNRVYQRLDVQWHDLFIRIKWDTIKSVLKSVAGLQGRKFKELLPNWGKEEGLDADKKAAGTGVKSWLVSLGKKKGAADGEEGEGPVNPETLKERAKSRLLLGSQHVSRVAGGSTSQLATIHSGTQSGDLPDEEAALSPRTLSGSSSTAPSGALLDIKASPLKPPVGPGKPAQGLSLDDVLGKAGKGRLDRSGNSAKPAAVEAPAQLSPAPSRPQRIESMQLSPAPSLEGAPVRGSPTDPAGVGLDLQDLLNRRGQPENADVEAESFTWGRDVRDEKAGRTTKTKAAKLFGRAGNMLKEASSNLAQAAKDRAAATAASKGNPPPAVPATKRALRPFLNRQQQLGVAQGPQPWSHAEAVEKEEEDVLGRGQHENFAPGHSMNLPARRPLSIAPGGDDEVGLPDWARSMAASPQAALVAGTKKGPAADPLPELPELIDLGSWDDAPAPTAEAAVAPAATSADGAAKGLPSGGAAAGTWNEQGASGSGMTGNPFAASLLKQQQLSGLEGHRVQSGNPFAAQISEGTIGPKTQPNAADDDFMDRLLDM